MRKSLIALLLASSLAPSAAYAQDEGQDRASRVEAQRAERASQREAARESRSQRSEQESRPERPERADRVERQADRAPRINQSGDLDRAVRSDRMQDSERPARAERPARVDRDAEPLQQAPVPVNVDRRDGRPDNLVDGFRQVARDNADGRDNDHRDHDRDWKKDWRKDKRYDWWNYRSRYSSLYRLGRYSDPYGWGYRRWSVGYNLWPSYYGSNYWLNDPWMYRLPPVYGPYRWVRYYDDALLVNIYSGHVVDTIYNFFW